MSEIEAMNFCIRTCLVGSLVLLLFFQTSAQEEEAPDFSIAEWYLNFFEKKDNSSIQKLLEEKSNQLLAAIEVQDDSAQTFVILEMGLIHLTRSVEHDHYERAMDEFIKALGLADSTNFIEGKIFSYLTIARVFTEVGNHEKSFQFLEKALEWSSKLKPGQIQALVLNELGKVNAVLGKTDEAFQNYSDALTLKEMEDLPRLQSAVLFNTAVAFELKHEYSKALDYHKRALVLRRSIGDRLQEAFLLNEIGEVYELMKNNERALANFTAALEVYQSINNKKGIADSYNSIGALYYQQNNTKQALANLELALSAGRTSQNNESVRRTYELLSLSYKALGDYKRALENKDLFIEMNDFMQKEVSDQKLLEAQSRYTIDQKETQIGKLESDNLKRERKIAEQKQIQFFLFVIIGLTAVVALLVLYMYLSKRRSNLQLKTINAKVEAQNIELQNLNATKDKFFSIIGHDLKGPLNSLTSFSNLLINYFDSLSKEEIQSLAKDLDKSLKNLYSLLNNLLEWARSQTGNVDFTPQVFDINIVLHENHELLNTQAANKQITILHESQKSLQVKAHQQSITTVVRNLISNAIKFTPPGGSIQLASSVVNGEAVISIMDSGVGMSEEVMKKLFRIDAKHSTMGTANEKGTGLGLILCKDFVEKNGGRLWVSSEEGKGSVFSFTLPIA